MIRLLEEVNSKDDIKTGQVWISKLGRLCVVTFEDGEEVDLKFEDKSGVTISKDRLINECQFVKDFGKVDIAMDHMKFKDDESQMKLEGVLNDVS